jgi:hypothetical protein
VHAGAQLCLAPFGKKDLEVTLRGVTGDSNSLSVRRAPAPPHRRALTARWQVDTIRAVTIPLLKNFGLSAG